MKKLLAVIGLISAFGAQSFAAGWTVAKVTNMSILKSNPVQYSLTYEESCLDMSSKPLVVKNGNELILGVLVFRAYNTRPCRKGPQFGNVIIPAGEGEAYGRVTIVKPDPFAE